MRVIKHGNLYELGIETCPNCGCQFAFSKKDVGTSYNRDEGYDEYYVSCPECTLSVSISSEKALCNMQV